MVRANSSAMPLASSTGLASGLAKIALGSEAKQHASGGRVVVQRLDPEAIAHQPQALLALVPQGEAVDAAEPGEGSLAPLQIGAQHHFGVRAGAEDLAQRLQLGAQLAEVVDLAAVGQRHPPASLGKHRLGAVLQVDDRQAPMAEQRVPRQPQAFGVRPARGQGTGHAFRMLRCSPRSRLQSVQPVIPHMDDVPCSDPLFPRSQGGAQGSAGAMVEDGSDGHGETPQGGGLLPEPAAPLAPEAAVLLLVDVAAGCRSHAAGKIAAARGRRGRRRADRIRGSRRRRGCRNRPGR